MPKYCRAPNCSNSAGQRRAAGERLSFYRFPLHNPERLQQWLSQMNQEKWVPTRYQHLCSEHFTPSCFEYRWGVRYLKPDAVPTIFQRSENPLVSCWSSTDVGPFQPTCLLLVELLTGCWDLSSQSKQLESKQLCQVTLTKG
uniref:THAP domain containing 8 n=1 Tax=Pelusios castaneus TaxID=367368 RepID=A0A8C8R774_9SAUR